MRGTPAGMRSSCALHRATKAPIHVAARLPRCKLTPTHALCAQVHDAKSATSAECWENTKKRGACARARQGPSKHGTNIHRMDPWAGCGCEATRLLPNMSILGPHRHHRESANKNKRENPSCNLDFPGSALIPGRGARTRTPNPGTGPRKEA